MHADSGLASAVGNDAGLAVTEPNDIERSRLRWRCRRGMRELDVLLERWLDRHWDEGSGAERDAFARLLSVEDDQLWSWMTGQSRPDDAELAAIVDQLAPPSRG